jgi:CheY-like chemotaxis protein
VTTDADARPTIVSIEDEAMNRALLKAVLSRSGDVRLTEANLVEATDLRAGRDALERLGDQVDILLLDVRLPDGSGLDLAREIMQRSERPKVAIMSASVLPEERSAAIDAGCDAFLGKPYPPAELVKLLLGWLDEGSAAA